MARGRAGGRFEQLPTRAQAPAMALVSEQAVRDLVAQAWTACLGAGLAPAPSGADHQTR